MIERSTVEHYRRLWRVALHSDLALVRTWARWKLLAIHCYVALIVTIVAAGISGLITLIRSL